MRRKEISILTVVLVTMFFISCSDNDSSEANKGQVSVKMTDAPSDDANIQGTFVTVSNVKIDGQSVDGFETQTIDISAYQNGETKLLCSDEIEAKSYNSITLELNYETDASGDSPGCYVLTEDNEKHNLTASSEAKTEITFNKNFNIESGQNTELVIDFDLRKAIKRDEESTETDYSFVTEAELESAMRLVLEDETGTIEGDVNNDTYADYEFVVYAYEKGEYNLLTETQGQGSGNLMFANAVTSAKVNEDGTYHLNFLKEGDYEIHVASYSRTTMDSELNFVEMASAVSNSTSWLLNQITVTSNTKVNVSIEITLSV